MCYSTGTSGPTTLSVCSQLSLVANCSATPILLLLYYCFYTTAPILLLLVLYCTMPFIATCVDAIGTVFWDRPVLRYPGESFDTCSKAVAFYFSGYTSFLTGLPALLSVGKLGSTENGGET